MNEALNSALKIDFAPLLPHPVLFSALAVALLFVFLSALFYRRGLLARTLCTAAFLLLFFNPSFVEEQRQIVPDVAVIAVDRSPSQGMGERTARTEAALDHLRQTLEAMPDIELRIADSSTGESGPARETHLFDKIDQVLADVPPGRRAGIIMLTDGQVHDAPREGSRLKAYGPVSVLLSGERNERDRRLLILEAPSYGIVGQNVTMRYRIEDTGDDLTPATVLMRQDNAPPRIETVSVNQDISMTVKIDHAGQNIFDMEVSPLENEITTANNQVPVIVNGVRDRLRVLLVSGQPHAGGRTWRNLLTADPGVDLVHFTILREPDKLDATPQHELSLIAFPFQELFEVKLYDFDLIIFDRYRLNRILPNYYFGNIAKYVKEGGALLEASGPDFAGENSIYGSELNQILPAFPTGEVISRRFTPALTETGRRHPVTQDLQGPGGEENAPGWGPWLRQVAVTPSAGRGETLLTGADNNPLLILDRAGKGRVAQLASDQIWLWSRGFEGGGPQAELLRRLAHWLMKEPELEENALDVRIDEGTLIIRRRSLSDTPIEAEITAPDDTRSKTTLTAGAQGYLEARLPAAQLGVYTVNDGTQQRFAVAGDINPPELSGVRTTEEKLNPLVEASEGTMMWMADTAAPAIRLLPPGRNYGGRNWIGLRANRSYNVANITNRPLLPEWVYAASLLFLVLGGWWLEGRSRTRS